MRTSLKASFTADLSEAGCDEAGRGCLAGPVVAAAVILPREFRHPMLNDSKQLTKRQRESLRPVIEREAIAWAVNFVSPEEIDATNILRASLTAMHRALDQLEARPAHILVDGNKFIAYRDIPHTCVIGGDALFQSIAAASVLAKTYRDAHMEALSGEFPEYGWERNKGYPTTAHRDAIHRYGPTPHHRMSFSLLPGQTRLDL
jgi:ribonuclease HII